VVPDEKVSLAGFTWEINMGTVVANQKATLFQLVDGNKQFRVPIYQRSYSWRQEHCSRLLEDIKDIANAPDGTSHFLGSVVYVAEGNHMVAGVNSFLVIDGQQRLTTLSLLLLALRKLAKDSTDFGIKPQTLGNRWLFNSDEDEADDRYLKLLLTRSDKATYRKLCLGIPLSPEDDNRVRANFEYFDTVLSGGRIDPKKIYAGIQRLQLVYICLELGKDNPQLIFESMNSTGLDLAQADLIRNFVLMGLPKILQDKIYNLHWFPMEQRFGQQYRDRFDSFMRTYLTVRMGTIPREGEVYAAFKKHVASLPVMDDGCNNHLMERVAADLQKQADFYASIVFGKESDPDLRTAFHDFSTLRADVAHPFFLRLYSDWKAGFLSREELLILVRLTESYVFRRFLCGIPTNSMNNTFANLEKGIDKQRYFRSAQAALLRLDSYRRFPRDAEVTQILADRDVYNSPRCAYLLERLENSYLPKEPIKASNYTTEHVMPQTLSLEWKTVLGENAEAIYQRYLHTLGNLTLTGYNSELSCRSFQDKLALEEGGFLSSPLALNKFIRQQTSWGSVQMVARGQMLAERVCQVWPFPDNSVLGEFVETTESEAGSYTLDGYDYLSGTMLDLYNIFEERVLALHPSVRRACKKLYIAFKLDTNFVDVVPQASRLRLALNMDFDEMDDPKGWCKDVTGLGRWGNGNVEVGLSELGQLDYILGLVEQSLNTQLQE
jgi:uncharacterized protein with ParB-like and HNH nuclease domain/predicted transport protein